MTSADRAELAEEIRTMFTPLVFACPCKGLDPDCGAALNDPTTWARHDVVSRIWSHITGQPLPMPLTGIGLPEDTH